MSLFLSQLHQDLDDAMGLGAFNIEERERPGGEDQGAVLGSVQRGGHDPYLVGLQDSPDRRFQHLEILGAFSVLGPQAAFSKVGPADGNEKTGLAV
ncbi:hypothetical protein J4Q44_G00058300 [Coregonus suidteri]|uniref:Uncharacterized protein n=1 Tax=Coregonus suidteri TaxID=861788 RepID=A0AAN8NAP8_9TELE